VCVCYVSSGTYNLNSVSLIVSVDVSCCQTLWMRILSFSDRAWGAQHSSTSAVQNNSQLHFSWLWPPAAQSWTQLITGTRFGESLSYRNIVPWVWAASHP